MKKFMQCCTLILLLMVCPILSTGSSSAKWISLFDGKTLNGWKASENPDTFKVENGMIVVNGPRAYFHDPDGTVLEFIDLTSYAGANI